MNFVKTVKCRLKKKKKFKIKNKNRKIFFKIYFETQTASAGYSSATVLHLIRNPKPNKKFIKIKTPGL